MAIRIRKINGVVIAVCAAETDENPGDVYLNDNIHHALVTKFSEDYNLGVSDKKLVQLMEKERVRDAKTELNKWIEAFNRL